MENVIRIHGECSELKNYLEINCVKVVMLVCGNSARKLKVYNDLLSIANSLGISLVEFSNFSPNPEYESVVEGVRLFNTKNCDSIIAIGGGSAIDVAKCIKVFSNMDEKVNYLKQTINCSDIRFLVIPTTAGTGSEATSFAVIYYMGEKYSVNNIGCLPEKVILDSSTLETLPLYQKKVTLLDALCHSIESFWSINSTEESKMYSKESIKLILTNSQAYFENLEEGNKKLLEASHLAGKAINITQTTAAHAMSYKLTKLYGIPHGQAVAVCLYFLWPYMVDNIRNCVDCRGVSFVENCFTELSQIFEECLEQNGISSYQNFYDSLKLPQIENQTDDDIDILVKSVNIQRLKNNPIRLEQNEIECLYKQIGNKLGNKSIFGCEGDKK